MPNEHWSKRNERTHGKEDTCQEYDMNKLTALIEVAKDAEYCKNDMRVHPTIILELCALLVHADEALKKMRRITCEPRLAFHADEALAAIKQWKEQI